MTTPRRPVPPAVTVVLATRNRARFLPDALRSILAQRTTCDFEVVVVDNGSTDDTDRVIREWCAADRRVRAVVEPRLGQSRAANAGAAVAGGDLLVFTDDDVVVDPNWLETFARFFAGRAGELVVAGGPIIPIPVDLGPWPAWLPDEAVDDVGVLRHGEERVLRDKEWIWGANLAVPAAVFARIGGWDAEVGHAGDRRSSTVFADIDLQERVRAAGGSVWFCAGAVLRHRVGPAQFEPRSVLRAAYSLGRDRCLAARVLAADPAAVPPPPPLARLLVALAGHLARLVAATAVFRVTGARGNFAAAHRAARAAGETVALVDDRGRLRLRRALRTVTVRTALAAFALAGAGPARRTATAATRRA